MLVLFSFQNLCSKLSDSNSESSLPVSTGWDNEHSHDISYTSPRAFLLDGQHLVCGLVPKFVEIAQKRVDEVVLVLLAG